MLRAIELAKKAIETDDVPIGCVIVKDDKIIAESSNMKEVNNDATKHAEMVAISKATEVLGNWWLEDCDVYVTLEPCPMCAGAIIQSRIRKVYFGAYEPKSGAVVSCNDIFDVSHGHNHKVDFEGGVLEEPCSKMMLDFFRNIRKRDSGK